MTWPHLPVLLQFLSYIHFIIFILPDCLQPVLIFFDFKQVEMTTA